MVDIPSISRAEIAARRRHLRRQRRWRIVQVSWRSVAVSGLAIGLVWAVSRPDWMLRDPSQVIIEGNKFLAADTIRSLLPIQYPQFLLTLQPKAIAQGLESQAPIAEVGVTRRLFPPSLTVRIQERYPVAVVYADSPSVNGQAVLKPIALLDEKGYVIPYDKYVALNRSRQLPTLKVIGNPEVFHDQWADLYQEISRSPVKVLDVDWHEPSNLILKTELGTVHFGSYGPRFVEQLRVLDQMRQLPKTVNLAQIDYINLSDPSHPSLQTEPSRPLKAQQESDATDATAPSSDPTDLSADSPADPPAPATDSPP